MTVPRVPTCGIGRDVSDQVGKYALRSFRISAPTTTTKKRNYCLLEVEQTPLNVSAEDLFENFIEPPSIPCRESESEQPQGTRVSTSTPRVKNR
ncbi:hypothetical protein TNCV_4236171 [Trichonephila clavipes]|nr:hypothetical protein TNCV_4236171 [Trichonephila clavipes]